MHNANLELVDVVGVLECKSDNLLTGLFGDKLDALYNSVNHNVLDARVFSLGVLSDQDGVNSIIWGLVASNGSAGPDVGEEVEGSAEGKIEGDMSFTNWCLSNVSSVLAL